MGQRGGGNASTSQRLVVQKCAITYNIGGHHQNPTEYLKLAQP